MKGSESITQNRYATFKAVPGSGAGRVSFEYGYNMFKRLLRVQESAVNAAKNFKDTDSYGKAVEAMSELMNKVHTVLENKESQVESQVKP